MRITHVAALGAIVVVTTAASSVDLTEQEQQGHDIFVHTWTRGDPRSHGGDGLGPSYNASSCDKCHALGGAGGGGGAHVNVVIVDGKVRHKHHPLGAGDDGVEGALQSIFGGTGSLGTALPELSTGGLRNRGFGTGGRGLGTLGGVFGTPSVTVQRNTTALFGDGLIDDIPDDVIEAGAAVSIAGHPEIRGKVGRTPEKRVARFGWKGDVADLVTFVSRACSVEVGLEVPGSPQPGKRPAGYDLDLDELQSLVAYVKALPKPVEVRDSPAQSEGAELFDSIGCTACHRTALGDVDGIYSDLLLHDMGADLDDVASSGYYGAPPVAGSAQWRTPPLWGVRDSGPWMHDGRAATLELAIRMHDGEAAKVRAAYNALKAEEQDAVVSFLESLRAPG